MDSDINQCSVCYERYDNLEHTPMTLPQCGHTLCLNCCQGILNKITNNPSCPSCRTAFIKKDGQYLQPQRNIYALNNLEKPDPFPNCSEHNLPKIYYCCEDNQPACSECYFTYHDGHKKENLKNHMELINQRKKDLESLQGDLKTYSSEIDKLLEAKKLETLEASKKVFKQIRTLIKKQEQEIQFKIISSFEQEKARLKNVLQGDSSLEKSIGKKIIDCQNFINLHTVIDENTRQIIEKYNRQNLETKFSTFFNNLNKISTLIMNNFQSSAETVEKLGSEEFFYQLYIQNPGTQHAEQSNDDLGDLNLSLAKESPFRMKSYFNFKVEDNKLIITLGDRLNEDCLIDINSWKELTSIDINLPSIYLQEQDISVLKYAFSQLNKIESLSIKGPQNISLKILEDKHSSIEQNFKILMKIILKLSNLETVSLCWENTKSEVSALETLVRDTLPNLSSLKGLEIRMLEADFDRGFCQQLVRGVNKLKTLENFSFKVKRFDALNMKESLVLPNLKKFDFIVSEQFALDTFLHESIRKMNGLENLNVYLAFGTNNIEQSALAFFKLLQKIKTLKMLSIVISDQQFQDIRRYVPAQDNRNFLKWSKAISEPILGIKGLQFLSIGSDFNTYNYQFNSPERFVEFINN